MSDHVKISPNAFVYPMPMTIVSSVVDGRVNHLAAAWINRCNPNPPLLSVALGKSHMTNRGIHQTGEFAVSIPPSELVKEVDQVGLVTGKTIDKSGFFPLFYGCLPNAPMVKSCPVTMACRVRQVVELPSDELFIAEIIEAYALDSCLSDGKPDIRLIDPILLTMPDNNYWRAGEHLAKAWKIGRG
ncbi:MAG: flavin reductase family protein [Myxococcota bacterium]|jgi:flavin reductase (DIM6/NTAB) family NADH-FMN oxidoreductase RutF